ETSENILKRIESDGGLDRLTIDQIAQVGALHLTDGLAKKDADYTPDEFRDGMVAVFGDIVTPHIDEIHQAALNIRKKWLADIAFEKQKSALQNKANSEEGRAALEAELNKRLDEDEIADEDIYAILNTRRDVKRRRNAVEKIHNLVSGFTGKQTATESEIAQLGKQEKGKPFSTSEIDTTIVELATDENVAAAAKMLSDNISKSDFVKRFKNLGFSIPQTIKLFYDGSILLEDVQKAIRANHAAILEDAAAQTKLVKDVQGEIALARDKVRQNQKDIARALEELKKSKLRKVADAAQIPGDVMRSLMTTGEISYILRQGFFPLVMFSKDGVRGIKGVKAGLSNEVSRLLYQQELEEHSRFSEAVKYGVKFAELGSRAEGDEHFRSDFMNKIPLYGRLEKAYTLPADAQRLFIFDSLSKVAEESGINPEQIVKAKEHAAYLANIITGKGTIDKVFGRGSYFTRFLSTVGFAPNFLSSRFESAFWFSPMGVALAPKGLKLTVAKKGLRMYGGIAAVALALAAMFQPDDEKKEVWSVLDPTDPNFLKVRLRNTNIRVDISGGMSNAMRLMFIDFMAAGYFVASGQTERLTDIFNNESELFSLRYLRGKLSPMASLAVDAVTGSDFIGNPINWKEGGYWGAVTSRLAPISWQQIYEALLYNPADSQLREPKTAAAALEKIGRIGRGEFSIANALSILVPAGLGVGINQYEKIAQSEAEEKAWSMNQPFSGKQKTAEEETMRRVKGGLRNLTRMKNQIEGAGGDAALYQKAIDAAVKKYNVTGEDLKEIKDQAKSGVFEFPTKTLSSSDIDTIIKYATADEKPELEKIKAEKVKNELKRTEKAANPADVADKLKRANTDKAVELYKEREDKLNEDQKKVFIDVIKAKADRAAKLDKLGSDELETIKEVDPGYEPPVRTSKLFKKWKPGNKVDKYAELRGLQ
ncbi:MAG TPA: hypothetical protein VNI84_07990, partial [Pyrinomonadaceae bacterium]|nr:hypothetical protein [Pyrinomonadaceae bacterium]